MQAVQSSDFAIGEFKILRNLILFHGRTNNIRISEMILYFFYKNFVFTISHFIYAFYSNCTAQTIIDSWFITFYNMVFTAFPLGVTSVLDFDLKPQDGNIIYLMMPFLYSENREYPILSRTSFSLTLLRGTIHCIINVLFSIYTLGVSGVDGDGNWADLWYLSVSIYTNIIFVRYYLIYLDCKLQIDHND